MTPAAHIAATIEILDLILEGEQVEASLTRWGRSNRFAGSGDRYAIRDLVFDALRQKSSLTKRSKNISGSARTYFYLIYQVIRYAKNHIC